MAIINIVKVVDRKILVWLNNLVSGWGFLNKIFAEYLIYIIPLVLLWMWLVGSMKTKKAAIRALLSAGVGAFILAKTIGHFVFRARPFDSGGIKELLFHRPDYSFPSDHATVFFAIAFSFWLSGEKKLAITFFILAAINGIFRVATGIHWPSDILAGVVLGLVAASIIYFLEKPLNIVYEFIIKTARKARLV